MRWHGKPKHDIACMGYVCLRGENQHLLLVSDLRNNLENLMQKCLALYPVATCDVCDGGDRYFPYRHVTQQAPHGDLSKVRQEANILNY